VIYVRVSSDPRGHQRSVSEQEAECRAVCEGEGWQVAHVYCDNDRSASRFATKARPGFAAMLAALDLGKADVLLTWESSRAQRDLGTFVELRQALMSRGVRWHYGGRCYDMSKARDRKETARDALDAEGASDETSERVQRSVRANAAAGRPHGKLLYGYRREYDPTTKALVGQFPHPEQAEVVRECAARVARGEALYAVAADLNARAVPAPRSGQWDPTQVRRLCVNPSYIAKRTHRGVVVGDANWPALLEAETHFACVARLTDPARRTNEGRGARHLLSGLLRCGVCGSRCHVLNNRGATSYQCHERFCTSRSQSAVDEMVAAVVVARLAQPDLVDLLSPDDDTDDERAKARAEAGELRARLSEHYAAAAAGDLSAQGLGRMEAALLPRIEAAERRTRQMLTSPLLRQVSGADAAERWGNLTLEQRRAVIGLLCSLTVLPVGRGHRTFDPASVRVDWKEA